jgi:hypothetical protein
MPLKQIDITGQKFNSLTALEIDRNENGKVFWKCKCDCGKIISVISSRLRYGEKKSCGCLAVYKSPEYFIWKNLKRIYKSSVCRKWQNFDGFLKEMGKRPEGCFLRRIDKSKGYYKGNCEWKEKKNKAG